MLYLCIQIKVLGHGYLGCEGKFFFYLFAKRLTPGRESGLLRLSWTGTLQVPSDVPSRPSEGSGPAKAPTADAWSLLKVKAQAGIVKTAGGNTMSQLGGQ